ncbi:cell division protein SepF [Streptococcus castoreus]|uniref:cell division protein SepF n=1 Tax=Streptococcus castoreus TaxID=254786 RepID=UPI0003FF1077|nr:cell division protein SepF [Streptococcus castoreus]
MAIKDTFNKMISYFDTDGVNEVEEETTASKKEEAVTRTQQSVRPSSQPQASRPKHPQQVQQTRPKPQPRPKQPSSERPYQSSQARVPLETTERKSNKAVSSAASRREQYQHSNQSNQTTIALKYPRKYEDAQEIVDLLIDNECVLIDFQYMLDAQARRCLDFIDGASKVLYGTLKKVGASMYLLTPSNVSVNIEDVNIPNNGQDISFDFDMKRR